MDPNAAWVELERAFAERERELIGRIADNLIGWLEMCGFPPSPSVRGRAFGELSPHELTAYLRSVRAVAEMK